MYNRLKIQLSEVLAAFPKVVMIEKRRDRKIERVISKGKRKKRYAPDGVLVLSVLSSLTSISPVFVL